MKKIIVLMFCFWTSVSVFSYTDLNYRTSDKPIVKYLSYLLQTSTLSLPKVILSDY